MPKTPCAKTLSSERNGWSAGAALALGLVAVVGCAKMEYRGNLPDPEVLATIETGKATRDEVTQKIGSPSSIAVFDDETWFYISQQVEHKAFFEPKIKDRQVLIMTFSKEGVVNDIRRLGIDDSRTVQHVGRVTPTAGNELTFLDQLVGNFGRFNKGDKDKAAGK